MKKVLFYILAFFTYCGNLFSQGYILPDIAAPGMNVYIECIARPEQKGFFGQDGVYDATKEGALTLSIRNSNGNIPCSIDFAPCIVSWEGRVLSTHVFIGSECTPNSSSWQELHPDWKMQILVLKDVQIIATYDFFIVQPWKLGDISQQSETVLGAGSLGRRSPRGALIADSLILRSGVDYSVSTDDTSPNEQGNQGYLPFTLLVQGRLACNNGTASINVNGISTIKGNAGPGGGGGGGSYYDAPIHNTNPNFGAEGGDGFTGGGSGGFNKGSSLLRRNQQRYNNAGLGSGGVPDSPSGGKSLNGVPGGFVEPGIFENAGGGTGHPFGSSGRGAEHQHDSSQHGGNGGGSGSANLQNGGGGNYASTTLPSKFDGKPHGNTMLVPLAGGSGGASGNPRATIFLSSIAGFGGGGGGAIAASALTVQNVYFYANGGMAQTGNLDAYGGHGSGGAVLLSTKNLIHNVQCQANGHSTPPASPSGDGFIRLNGFGKLAINSNNEPFYGIATDTTTYISRNFSLTLQCSSPELRLLYKPKGKNTIWKEITTTKKEIFESFITLSCLLDNLSPHDTVIYVVAIQSMQQERLSNDATIPKAIYSQSGANILRLTLPPPTIASEQTTAPLPSSCKVIQYQNTAESGFHPSAPIDEPLSLSLLDSIAPEKSDIMADILQQQTMRTSGTASENQLTFIAPNPAQDNITVSTRIQGSILCSISDNNGRLVFTNNFNNTSDKLFSFSVDVSSWSNGIYFINLQNTTKEIYSYILLIRR